MSKDISCEKCGVVAKTHPDTATIFSFTCCGIDATYCKTSCCNLYVKFLDVSVEKNKITDNFLITCNCGRYYVHSEFNGEVVVTPQLNSDKLQMLVMQEIFNKKLNELENKLNKIDVLESKLTRLLDMVEFAPEGGPGAVEAKKLFTEHSNTN